MPAPTMMMRIVMSFVVVVSQVDREVVKGNPILSATLQFC